MKALHRPHRFLSIAMLIATMVVTGACQSSAPPAGPAAAQTPVPPPPPMSGSVGGPPGTFNPHPEQGLTPVAPPPNPATPVAAAQKAADTAPDDVNDWVDSSWKLFKSSLKTTFTTSSHKIRSPQGGLNFTYLQPIYLDVSNLEVVDEYKSPMQEPYVEHLVPLSPSEAMHIWVKDRLRSSGGDRTLQVIIKDASIKSNPLPPAPGADPDDAPTNVRRYDARLEVDLRIYGTDAMSEASVVVVATQSNTIGEAASLADRKAIYKQMMFDLMDSANAELEKQIFKYFTRYISYAQTP